LNASLRPILRRVRHRPFVVKHLAEITAIDPTEAALPGSAFDQGSASARVEDVALVGAGALTAAAAEARIFARRHAPAPGTDDILARWRLLS